MAPTWPVIGRDEELATLLRLLRGGVGAVVVGEAGLGKTVLAGEVKRRLELEGWHTDLLLCCGRLEVPLQGLAQGRNGKARALLVVDDAHLLDDESAESLWRIATSGATQVVATVRSGEKTPDRVARLWSGGSCQRLNLRPLGEADIRALLEHLLGGDVEDRLPRLLVQRAAGNALLLRELIRSGLDSGAIVRSHEVWRLAGPLPLGDGAADLIRAGLSGLADAALEGAQLIAVGEPLRLTLARQAIGDPVLEDLEAKGLLLVQDTVDGPAVTLTHPLYGSVLRHDLPALRSHRLRRRLIAAIQSSTPATPREVLCSALWRVELQDPIDGGELIAAARLARSSSSVTAELLTRAAIKADPGSVEAVVLLAEVLSTQGRVAEMDRLLDGIELDSQNDADRRAVLYWRALGRTRLGEVREVAAMIATTPVDVSAPQLQAMHAQALMLDGALGEAMAVARPVFDDESNDPASRTLAAITLVAGGTYTGEFAETERAMNAVLPLADASRGALPFGTATVKVSGVIARCAVGRLDAAEALAHQMYDEALTADDEWLRPRGASALGIAALMRGQARTATRYFRITVASLNEFDGLFLRYNLSFLARAAVLAGFTEEARAALDPPADAPQFPLFRADWERAEAGLLAAEGKLSAAAEQVVNAARTAARFGAWGSVLFAAHDAARYTGSAEAAELVMTAADRIDGPLPHTVSMHAHARATRDPHLLSDVSARFEELGAILFAAEAAYAAARAFQDAGEARRAASSIVRGRALHARCEDAAIPWVSGFQSVAALTPREQEIALLAAAGLPDLAIANELGLSVRTVQNHLTHGYAKLGVANRQALPKALAPAGVPLEGSCAVAE